MDFNQFPIVITDWNVVSNLGIGKDSFRNSLLANKPVNFKVSNFDVKELLGKKGTRLYDRSTSFVNVVAKLISENGTNLDKSTGVVLGTTYGSISSICNFVEDIYVSEKPYLVDPSRFPNTVMNCPASQVAIRFGLEGSNTTLSGGDLASIKAMNYAINSLYNGYSNSLLVGSVEEYYEKFSELNLLNEPNEIGEGCALFLIENFNDKSEYSNKPLAQIINCTYKYSGGAESKNIKKGLLDCLNSVFNFNNSVKDLDLSIFINQKEQSEFYQLEVSTYEGIFENNTKIFNLNNYVGDCKSFSGSVQLASFLALLSTDNSSEYGLVTSIDRSGLIGMLLLRRWTS